MPGSVLEHGSLLYDPAINFAAYYEKVFFSSSGILYFDEEISLYEEGNFLISRRNFA